METAASVMETEAGSPIPDKFRSIPGAVFPLYHVLADVGEFAGGEVIPTISSENLKIDGLALQKDGQIRVILANLSAESLDVSVENLSKQVQARHLDETNVETAMVSPEDFRMQIDDQQYPENGVLHLRLLPYAIIRIDSVA